MHPMLAPAGADILPGLQTLVLPGGGARDALFPQCSLAVGLNTCMAQLLIGGGPSNHPPSLLALQGRCGP